VTSAADPAAPLSGREIQGIESVTPAVDDAQLDQLIAGGVTVFEMTGGRCEMVRAVTTRTISDGVPDRTFLDVNTILVVDNVLIAVRGALKARLRGQKNNAATRTAIATQAAVELEAKKAAAIIDDYDQPRVYAAAGNPTACLCEIGFTVVSGLNQIHISAHVTV